jgi:hypothetical protein
VAALLCIPSSIAPLVFQTPTLASCAMKKAGLFARKGDRPQANTQLSLHVDGAPTQAEQDEEAEEVPRRRTPAVLHSCQPRARLAITPLCLARRR